MPGCIHAACLTPKPLKTYFARDAGITSVGALHSSIHNYLVLAYNIVYLYIDNTVHICYKKGRKLIEKRCLTILRNSCNCIHMVFDITAGLVRKHAIKHMRPILRSQFY